MFAIVLLLVFVNYFNTGTASSLGFDEVTNCINKERQALLTFKAGLIDDYNTLSSWSSEECCNWSGVKCSYRTGHVIELDIQGFSVRGNYISPSLLELRELNYLDLSLNDFEYRPIPNFFGSFTKLQHLYLIESNFSGTIPSQLGNLSDLIYLDLRWNDFENRPIPHFFGSFTKLQHLDLSGSNFGGTIPSQLGNLSDLNYLTLGNCVGGRNLSVENLDWLSHLSSLEYLDMSFINLSRATNWVDIIKNLPSLSYVSLEYCELSKVVSPSLSLINSSTSIETLELSFNGFTSSMYNWLFNLTNSVTHLYLSDNLLEGMIPKSFKHLCNLQELFLHNNSLSGNFSDFVDNLSGCPEATLESLDVDSNKLFGTLPQAILNFSSLKYLSLSKNKLSEFFTKNLGKISMLQDLDLSFNSLGVVTDDQLSSFSHLTALDLSFNHLDLQISPQWVPPFQLKDIRLMSCNLGPHFPQWIRTQHRFDYLDISNNSFDNIPKWFWNVTGRCTYLNLSSNNIGGTLPDLSSFFAPLPSKNTFDLSSNNFEGPVPLLLSSFAVLNLSKNKFSGTLSFLCHPSRVALQILDISNNFLTEEIPHCLGKLQKLVVLNLSHNKLSGKIPSSVGTLLKLETLYLYNNSFFGELPFSLTNCRKLIFLDVGVNKLSGNVPAWLGEKISNLYFLSLRSNNFFGTIPSNICWLMTLHVLDLSINNLSGTIPPCLNNLNAMVQKELVINYDHAMDISAYVAHTGYSDHSMIRWQGRELEFGKNLQFVKGIDLSSNDLTGEIPSEITELVELVALNLSRNALHGKVPQQIGRLNYSLSSLDLSRNRLSGKLPPSLSELNFLEYLDVSYNNFFGRIPSGTQLQGFNASNYIGNVGLCGPPLTSKCPGDEPPPLVDDNEDYREDNDEYEKWIYFGMTVGFVTGFWGTCGALLLNRRGRHAFFHFIDDLKDWMYVKMAVNLAR